MHLKENQNLYKNSIKNVSFQNELLKIEQDYKSLWQQAQYADLSGINGMLERISFNNKILYFIYAGKYPQEEKMQKKVNLYLIKKLLKPKQNYSFIYVSSNQTNHSFNDFKNMLNLLPIDFFLYLEDLLIIKQSFFTKASSFLTFGIINKFIITKKIDFNSIKQLSQYLKWDYKDLINKMPIQVINQLSQSQKSINQVRSILNTVFLEKKIQQCPKNIIKNAKKSLTQYEIGEIGIPIIIELLIYYFHQKPEGLLLQGLFRKSISIEDELELLGQLYSSNYDFLNKVEDAHIIANLIKRVISALDPPLIPYKQYDKLILLENDSNYVSNIAQIINKIPLINYMTLMHLFRFLTEQLLPKSDTNKMIEENIAKCFAPCIMKNKCDPLKYLKDLSQCIEITKNLIINFIKIFGNKKQQNKIYRNSYFLLKKQSFQSNQINNQKKKKKIFQQEITIKSNEKQQSKQLENNNSSQLFESNILNVFLNLAKQPVNQPRQENDQGPQWQEQVREQNYTKNGGLKILSNTAQFCLTFCNAKKQQLGIEESEQFLVDTVQADEILEDFFNNYKQEQLSESQSFTRENRKHWQGEQSEIVIGRQNVSEKIEIDPEDYYYDEQEQKKAISSKYTHKSMNTKIIHLGGNGLARKIDDQQKN